MWPSLSDHLCRRVTYPLGHQVINRFSRPAWLRPETGGTARVRWLGSALPSSGRHYAGCFLVCFNPRQSRLTYTPAVTHRDAPLPEWYEFLRTVGRRYPDVHFFMLGGFSEWEHTLLRLGNVSTHIEHFFASYAGVEPNARRYPFAAANQYLVWKREDASLLLDYFERVYHAAREVPMDGVA